MTNMTINGTKGWIPVGLTDAANATLEALRNLPKAEVVEAVQTAEDLANVSAENASKFLPMIFQNDLSLAEKIGDIGSCLVEHASHIGKLTLELGKTNGRLLAIGVAAAFGIGYLWQKSKRNEARIRELEQQMMDKFGMR